MQAMSAGQRAMAHQPESPTGLDTCSRCDQATGSDKDRQGIHPSTINTTPDQEDSPSLTEPDVPKEGLNAWLQVLGAFCLNLNTWGLMNSYGTFQTFYQLHLLQSHSSSNIAWIGSTQAFLLFFISIITGPIFDAGYLALLLWTGSALVVIGSFFIGIASQYWQIFLAQALMMGIGFGLLYLPAPAVVSQYFHAHTALAMGASSAGSALGGVVYPLVFSRLEPGIGFGWASRVLAFIVLATSAIPILLMKTKAGPTQASTSIRKRECSLIDYSAFRDLPYLLLNVGLCFGFMGLYVILYYIELFALDYNISTSISQYLLMIINLSSLPGRLIPGYYADKVGSINIQFSVALLSMVLTFCLIAIRSDAALVVFAVLFGFSTGAFMGLPAAGIVSLSADKSKIGTRIGMTLGFVGIGVLVSNPIAGAILGEDKNWVGLISWCGALLTASSLTMAACRISKVGTKLKSII